jgi:hypothetical protein
LEGQTWSKYYAKNSWELHHGKLLRQHSSLKNQKKKLSDKALSKAAATTTNAQPEQ